MILITGADGLIGRSLAAMFHARGEALRLQYRSEQNMQQAKLLPIAALNDGAADASRKKTESLRNLLRQGAATEAVQFDFATTHEADFERLCDGCSTVIHTAGLVHAPKSDAELYALLNVRATRLLSEASKARAVQNFVFFSTSAVYGNGPFINVEETVTPSPQTPYAVSKANCEEWLRSEPPAQRTIVFRPSLVFGEGDRGNMRSLIKQVQNGLYFHLSGNSAQKSVIYSGDVSAAVARCLETLSPGYAVFNLAEANPVSVVELADLIARRLGKPAPPTVPTGLLSAAASLGETLLGGRSPLTHDRIGKLMTTTTLSVYKLISATNFRPSYGLSDGLDREIAWLSEPS